MEAFEGAGLEVGAGGGEETSVRVDGEWMDSAGAIEETLGCCCLLRFQLNDLNRELIDSM